MTAPSKLGERTPVSTLVELNTLDDDKIVEGYRSGLDGEPEPGNNRSKAFWHGWRNGAMDSGRLRHDAESGELVRAYLADMRAKRESATLLNPEQDHAK